VNKAEHLYKEWMGTKARYDQLEGLVIADLKKRGEKPVVVRMPDKAFLIRLDPTTLKGHDKVLVEETELI